MLCIPHCRSNPTNTRRELLIMSLPLPRSIERPIKVVQPAFYLANPPHTKSGADSTNQIGTAISKLWISEGHPVNRKTGKRESGGPFHVTHTGSFIEPGHVSDIIRNNVTHNLRYTGPVFGPMADSAALKAMFDGTASPLDENSMKADGTTAISQCAPNNPTTTLGTGLAETFREGFPTLPGIQSWKRRTEALKNLGSEYLGYQFGWAPLHSEVQDVTNAARHHRDIMQNYRHNEGKPVHRRFDFPDETQRYEEEISSLSPIAGKLDTTWLTAAGTPAKRKVVYEKTTKRWFEGSFSYGGPGKADNFDQALHFGSEADAVYGLKLTPTLLWELAPWSWAVDWFSNAGDVINNVTLFGTAGLVMRYGFMMSETHESYHTEWSDGNFCRLVGTTAEPKIVPQYEGRGKRGLFKITKSRIPASPFGFGVGWEDLSPTQLAITAAIGITRLL